MRKVKAGKVLEILRIKVNYNRTRRSKEHTHLYNKMQKGKVIKLKN